MFGDAAARKRRFLSHRSYTLAALPRELLIAEVDDEGEEEDEDEEEDEERVSEQTRLIRLSESGGEQEKAEAEPRRVVFQPEPLRLQRQLSEPVASHSSARELPVYRAACGASAVHQLPSGGSGGGGSHVARAKRTRFQQRRSVTMSSEFPHSQAMAPTERATAGGGGAGGDDLCHLTGHQQQSQQQLLLQPLKCKKSGNGSGSRSPKSPKSPKSPTAPVVLFTKVKERIRQKVFQSSEWSSAPAVVQERRHRANEALQESRRRDLMSEQIQLHELHHKKKSGRSGGKNSGESVVKYEMAVAGDGDTDAVRAAFIRRRSISEDTYDRPPPGTKAKSGVICSNEDLMDIVQSQDSATAGPNMHPMPKSRPFRKRSPRPMRYTRAQSLDSGRMTRALLDAHVSCDSSSSTMSSIRTVDSADSETPSINSGRLDSDSSTHGLYPEVILDDRSKETIMEDDEDDVDEGDDDGSMNGSQSGSGSKTPMAIPECIYDENGQTWDIYGAEFDPEILGSAIQKHLEKLMERKCCSGESRRESEISLQYARELCPVDLDVVKDHSNRDTGSKDSAESSFWFRLLCLFAGRSEVTS